MKKLHIAVIAVTAAFALAGCEDPAKDKPAATVGSAKPTPAETAATKPDGETKTATAPASGGWTLAEGSKVEFVGSKVTGKHEGGFKVVKATAKLADGKVEGGSVEVEIDMKSTFSDEDGLTKHLMGADFFDVENHGAAKFVSTEVKAGGADGASHTVAGNLTLRGETKGIEFPATIEVKDDLVTVKSEFSINRKDFKIEYAGKADDLINDLVVIKLDLQFKKA
ncbi:MAG: YceI family protein [Myxococcales bacterium]|nr:YceI family protein [Myxococcales bacterium]